jgi:hypothetical protein
MVIKCKDISLKQNFEHSNTVSVFIISQFSSILMEAVARGDFTAKLWI